MTSKPTDDKPAPRPASPDAAVSLETPVEAKLDDLSNQPRGGVADLNAALAATSPAELVAREALASLDSRTIARSLLGGAADQLRATVDSVLGPVPVTDTLLMHTTPDRRKDGGGISLSSALEGTTSLLATQSAASTSLRDLALSLDGSAAARLINMNESATATLIASKAKSILGFPALPSSASFGINALLDAERVTSVKLLKIAEEAASSSAASLRMLTDSISATQLSKSTLALLSSAGAVNFPAADSILGQFETIAREHSAFESVTAQIAKQFKEATPRASVFGTANASADSLVGTFAVERATIYDTFAKHAADADASIALQTLQFSKAPAFGPLRLPNVSEIDLGLRQLGAVSTLASSLEVDFLKKLKADVGALSSPWVGAKTAFASIQTFSELQGIGAAVRKLPAFSNGLTEALRVDFGDWRTAPTYDTVGILEPLARTELYVAQGLRRDLSSADDEALAVGFKVAGLGLDYLTSTSFEQFVPPDASPAETAARRRMGMCYDILWKLERELRDYIDRLMTAQYGKGWPKQRLSPAMLAEWNEKAKKLEAQGRPVERLIDVADFTDYAPIICRSDDFKLLFVTSFRCEAVSVREGLNKCMFLA